jgi:hypothetical protein
MFNRREAFFGFGVLALSSSVRAQKDAPSNDDELSKLVAAFDFFRKRNGDDYAIGCAQICTRCFHEQSNGKDRGAASAFWAISPVRSRGTGTHGFATS